MLLASCSLRSPHHIRQERHSLHLSLDQLGINIAVRYPVGDSDKYLALLCCFGMCNPLRFRLDLDRVHDERVEIQHRLLHHRLERLKDEHHGDGTFGEDFGRMKSAREEVVLLS